MDVKTFDRIDYFTNFLKVSTIISCNESMKQFMGLFLLISIMHQFIWRKIANVQSFSTVAQLSRTILRNTVIGFWGELESYHKLFVSTLLPLQYLL